LFYAMRFSKAMLRSIASLLLVAPLVAAPAAAADSLPGLAGVKRVVFLGDSITHSGQYIDILDAYLAARLGGKAPELVNLGLPSETVSGLSEPGHANGKFPRPDLHERLARVLAQTRPDLVVACYGMNCGIYYPLAEERFAKFRAGIERLHAEVARAGAKIVHITPPTFDPLPIADRTLPAGAAEYRQPYAGYNDVLDRYSAWLIGQRGDGWDVVDLHGPLNDLLAEKRKTDPQFSLARDGVHMNAEGHWLAARLLLLHWGAPADEINAASSADDLLRRTPHGAAIYKLVQARQRLLKDAWLSDVGHLRPGMKKGVPLAEGQQQAAQITRQIDALVKP
jgi:lysophospholipase L1-like esterase